MLWGKECRVHMGACFSGGSRLAPAGKERGLVGEWRRHAVIGMMISVNPPWFSVQTTGTDKQCTSNSEQ